MLKNGLHNSSITAQKFNMNPGREQGKEGRKGREGEGREGGKKAVREGR